VKARDLSNLLSQGAVEPDLVHQIQRGKRFRSVGWLGVIGSISVFAASKLIPFADGPLSAILATLLVVSLALITWTQLWFKESREPFQYTYSVGEFNPVAETAHGSTATGHLAWMTSDLKAKLAERVGRLSLLDEEVVPEAEPDETSASHVHISGWHGLRHNSHGWELEVVPEVRLGGRGAPTQLASVVRLRLDTSTATGPLTQRTLPPKLSENGYEMLFERVYWSVASQIYAQIHRGVEEKVRLLPWGALRASAYTHEAEDYANSNTLDAYAAAQQLYRRALEIYDIRYRGPAAGFLRKNGYRLLRGFGRLRAFQRRLRSRVWRRAGRRDVMTARGELGLARVLVAEWQLGQLCGMARKEIYEATEFVDRAIDRLSALPFDVNDRQATTFRAYVARATIRCQLKDSCGARDALADARRLLPSRASEDAEYLYAAGLVEADRQLSLRLFNQAVELAPTMERALFLRAEQYDILWRRQEPVEVDLAPAVEAGYQDVIALNPGNLSAWSRRGYLAWLLAEDADKGRDEWRERAISSLRTGRQYKDVRREASVAELDWNLARIAAEEGDFTTAYQHYIEAVSARLGDPRIDFEADFYVNPTKVMARRFWRYRRRVLELANQANDNSSDGDRMVKSVKAFVLNDCGLACQAHYERSGDEKNLKRAFTCFEEAIDENDAFVLPAHNLAKLYLERSQMPGCSTEEASHLLQEAAQHLRKVLRREPQWAPAQLLMVEVQTDLALVAAELRADADTSRIRDPGGGADLEAVQTARADRALRALETGAYDTVIEQLRSLLPHEALRDKAGRSLIDLEGTNVGQLLRDNGIRWNKDFDAFHVEALTRWAKLLAYTAPAVGYLLCLHLRKIYSQSEIQLLGAQRIAAKAVVEAHESIEAAETVEECDALYRDQIRAALRKDPVDLRALKATEWLTPEERRQALRNALDGRPSATAMVWIGDAQQGLGDINGAIETYQQASRSGRTAIGPIASLKLAQLLEKEDRVEKAVEAYRLAVSADDLEVATDGAAGAARLLRSVGKNTEAVEVCVEAANNPRVALRLADRLEEEDAKAGAIPVYDRALESSEVDADLRVKLQISLVAALLEGAEGRVPRAETILASMGAQARPPVNWQAKCILAGFLAEEEPSQARELNEEVAYGADPECAAISVRRLGTMMEAEGNIDDATGFYRERAEANPELKEQLLKLLQENGEDVEAFEARLQPDLPAIAD
jgi:hypothetical protein